MTLFFIAGEKSGDLHASKVIEQVKIAQPNVRIHCWGGNAMAQAGGHLLKHRDLFGVMGFSAVFTKLFYFWSLLRTCKAHLLQTKPDVLVLVDFSGFNMRVARIAKKLGIRVCYYIPPKTWAWGEWRLKRLKRLTDQVLCIFPFEEAYFQKAGINAKFIGNPTYEQLIGSRELEPNATSTSNKTISILPGSRKQEVVKSLSIVKGISALYPEWVFRVAAVSQLDQIIYEAVGLLPNVELVWDQSAEVLGESRAAVVNSGTATLEAALLGVPQVVIYKTSRLNYLLAKWLMRLPYISLVNILLKRILVSECIQHRCTPPNIARELDLLLHDNKRQKKISEGYSEIRDMLADKQASKEAAHHIVALCSS